MNILDTKKKELQNKSIDYVKVYWNEHFNIEVTLELEINMREKLLSRFTTWVCSKVLKRKLFK